MKPFQLVVLLSAARHPRGVLRILLPSASDLRKGKCRTRTAFVTLTIASRIQIMMKGTGSSHLNQANSLAPLNDRHQSLTESSRRKTWCMLVTQSWGSITNTRPSIGGDFCTDAPVRSL